MGIILFQSCASQSYMEKETLLKLIDQKEFTFMAERALPTDYDVINVLNSMPNATSSRVLDLSYGYTIEVKGDELNVTLPYFGRTFNPSMDQDKSSLRFTSKDYTLTKSAGKKGNTVVTLKPNDVRYISAIYLDISTTGHAYASVNANDRAPISFDGYIMKNEVKK